MLLRSQGKLKFLLLGNHVNYELNPPAACQKESELKRKPFFFLESRKFYFLEGRSRAQAKQKPQEIKLVQTQTGIGWGTRAFTVGIICTTYRRTSTKGNNKFKQWRRRRRGRLVMLNAALFAFPKNINITKKNLPCYNTWKSGNNELHPVMCSQCRIRKSWISLSVRLVYRTEAHAKLPDVIWHLTRHNWL